MENKLISLVSDLSSTVKGRVNHFKGNISNYNKSMIDNGLIYSTEWYLEDAMISEHFLRRFKPISDLVENMNNPNDLEELKRQLDYLKKECIYVFEFSQFAPKSNSTTTNFSRLCDGRACGLLHSTINDMFKILDKINLITKKS